MSRKRPLHCTARASAVCYVDIGPIVLRAFCHGLISGSQSVAQPGFLASTAETTKCAHKNNRGSGALQYFYAPANITLALEGSVM